MCFPPSSSFGTKTTGHGGFKQELVDAVEALNEASVAQAEKDPEKKRYGGY